MPALLAFEQDNPRYAHIKHTVDTGMLLNMLIPNLMRVILL